jgi:hypothetical protein
MEEGAHEIPDLRFRGFGSFDAAQPFFNCDWPYLIESMGPPSWQNPILQIALVRGPSGKRLASLVLTYQLLKPIVSNKFGDGARPASSLRGLLVGVNAQRMRCFQGGCFRG